MAQAIAINVIKRRHFIKNVLIKMGLVEKIKEIEEEMAELKKIKPLSTTWVSSRLSWPNTGPSYWSLLRVVPRERASRCRRWEMLECA